MQVLMISGKAGHGKDTFATLLKEQLEQQNKTVLIIKFGDAVKWLASKYMNYRDIKDQQDREILQMLGTEIMRQYNEDYWAELVGQFLAAMDTQDRWQYCIISDWRFPNEYDVLSKYFNNIITIRMERYNYINPSMSFLQKKHISECALDNFAFNWIIENHNDINDLKESAKILISQL